MNYILKRDYLIKPSSVITDAVFLCQKESEKLTPFCVNFSSESLFFYDNHLTHTGRECNLHKTFSFSNTYSCFLLQLSSILDFVLLTFPFQACKNLLHGCMGKLQPAKIYYMAVWEICSLQKSVTWLHGKFAACKNLLHGCMEAS